METGKPNSTPSRRKFLTLIGTAGGAVALSSLVAYLLSGTEAARPEVRVPQQPSRENTPSEAVVQRNLPPPNLPFSLEDYRRNFVSGGPPPDGIPSIDNPKYISANKATEFLKDSDVVFGVNYRGVIKAFPQKILVWHEIVNENFNGVKGSITYCPLTGSTIGYLPRGPNGEDLKSFGTSGGLINSNLVMYDRLSGVESLWPQILGAAISGPFRGFRLEEFPVVWTRWGLWRRRFPETRVLSRETGFVRSYGRDPYGSYELKGTYYDSGGPFFPVMEQSTAFPDKKVVVGVKAGGLRMAIPKDEMKIAKVANAKLGDTPLVALYDASLDTVRVFSRAVEGRQPKFRLEGGRVVDSETGSVWSPEGEALSGPMRGAKLRRVESWDVMWFAWFAFFPDTEILEVNV